MSWWLDNDLRMIQNNLRDIDGGMDVEAWFEEIRASHANCVMVGAGGITSFFPTKLPYQTMSPYLFKDGMPRDLLGEITEICHKNGVRVIARFDFSKTHERLLAEHPEWYYVASDGSHLYYNDTAVTCVCGEYQQEKSIEILREVLEQYPVDGVFFNMFGFQTKDYSNVEHGICHCPSCRKAYRAFSGKELPDAASWRTDADYAAFKEKTVGDLLLRIQQAVREIRPGTAVCTYHHRGVDIIRDESNSAVDRPLPFNLYSASENCQTVSYSWAGEKTIANVAINAVDIFYRFQGVSPELTKLRLYENLAAGSQLDYCIIGDFADYPDRAGVEAMREVFRYHEEHEALYGHLGSEARVLLYRGARHSHEYLGWFKMLKEAHIPFDVIDHPAALEHPERALGHDIMIVPDCFPVPEDILSAAMESGEKVLFSGLVRADSLSEALLSKLGASWENTLTNTRAAYLNTADKTCFPSFPERDWVILDRSFGVFRAECGALPLVRPTMFGPPERCFGHVQGSEPGLIEAPDGSLAAFTFGIGALYYDYGYADHRDIAMDTIRRLAPDAVLIETNAPACIEMYLNVLPDGRHLLQCLNLSGWNGTTMEKCIPVRDVTVHACGMTMDLPPLELYQAFIVEEFGGLS